MMDACSRLELARLRRQAPSTPPPAPKKLREIIVPFLSLIQAIAVVGLGYWLVQRVELALKERDAFVKESQHSMQTASALKHLLTQINDAKTREEQERAVVQIAMHGDAALYPLFVLAASKNPYPADAVVPGLRLLAVRDTARVCELLRSGMATEGAVNELRKGALSELIAEVCSPLKVVR